MLEFHAESICTNISNIIGNSMVEGQQVATFNATYSSGMAGMGMMGPAGGSGNFTTSKSITNITLYNANISRVEADYKEFETKVLNLVNDLNANISESAKSSTTETM